MGNFSTVFDTLFFLGQAYLSDLLFPFELLGCIVASAIYLAHQPFPLSNPDKKTTGLSINLYAVSLVPLLALLGYRTDPIPSLATAALLFLAHFAWMGSIVDK